MGKGKKAKPRVDNSARIARGAARKARNVERNAMAHLRNEELAETLGVKPGKGKDRPSVQIRRANREAERLRLTPGEVEQLEAAIADAGRTKIDGRYLN